MNNMMTKSMYNIDLYIFLRKFIEYTGLVLKN